MKYKAILFTPIILIFLLSCYTSNAAIPGYTTVKRPVLVYINSNLVKLKLPLLTDNNRILCPMRELLEYTGARVSWDGKKKLAEVESDNMKLIFPLGVDKYYINGREMKMDARTLSDPAAQRLYIPIRYAFEALGYDVQWINGQKHDEIRIYKFKPLKTISDDEYLKRFFKADRTSIQYYDFDVEKKRIIFKDEYGILAYRNKTLQATINPDINRQVYELAKVLASDDQYLRLYYMPDSGEEKNSTVSVVFAKGAAQWAIGATYFNFCFQEKYYHNAKTNWKFDKFSDKAFLTLVLNQLYWGGNSFSSNFFEEKLHSSLITLFGTESGNEIFRYIYGKYIRERTAEDAGYFYYKGTRDSKIIKNIKIDYILDTADIFYFSYLN